MLDLIDASLADQVVSSTQQILVSAVLSTGSEVFAVDSFFFLEYLYLVSEA